MTHSVTIVADHKGFALPKVMGDEYIVVADVEISAFRTGTTATAASQTITARATEKDFTRTAGSYITDGFEVGDIVTIAGSHATNNALLIPVTAVTALVLTTDATTVADTGGGNEQITHAGEKILATSLGLTSITSVRIVGQNKFANNYYVGRTTTVRDAFYIYSHASGPIVETSNASLPTGDLGTLRLEVRGTL